MVSKLFITYVCVKYLLILSQSSKQNNFSTRISYNLFGQVSRPKWEVERIEELKKGDHVAFDRGAYWHHAIVEDIQEDTLHVIEYNLKILESEYPSKENKFYVVKHSKNKEERNALEKAKEGLKIQEKYNPYYRNCEHFANSCAEGENASEQSEQYWRVMILIIGRLMVSFCLFLFKFGMLHTLAVRIPLSETPLTSRVYWSLILEASLAAALEGFFFILDIAETVSFTRCRPIKISFCGMIIRIAYGVLSIKLMILFSWLSREDQDINRAGTALIAGCGGTVLGYIIVAIIVHCIQNRKKILNCIKACKNCNCCKEEDS